MTAIRATREFVAMMVRQHGRKRGLALAGAAVERSEHWARAVHYGEAHSVSLDVAIRAEAARLELSRQRAAQLRAELADLERTLHGDNLDAACCRSAVRR
jgi:hypothetical protein